LNSVVVELEDVLPPSYGAERVIDIEVSQGNQCVTSPPFPLKNYQSKLSLDWECCIPVTPGVPLHFTLKIRELTSENSLKRSQSTKIGIKDGLKSIRTKIFGKSSDDRSSVNQEAELTMTHSGSCASFSSISSSGFKRESIKDLGNPTYHVKTGQFNVINVSDWLEPMTGSLETQSLKFFQTEWEKPRNSFFQKPAELLSLCKFTLQCVFIESNRSLVLFTY
jgi:hypothetical protein